jgi:hypothetical protein
MNSSAATVLEPRDPVAVMPPRRATPAVSGGWRETLEFPLFILVNGMLLLRPAEIVSGWEGLHLYELSIIAALAAALPSILQQFHQRSLALRPITVCVLGMLVAVVLSHLANGDVAGALSGGIEFAKVVLYYLLLVGVINSVDRLKRFLGWLAILLVTLGGLSVMQYRGMIDVPEMRPIRDMHTDRDTGRDVIFRRMIGPGIFHDPNDLSHILAVGVILCVYQASLQRSWLRRAAWLPAAGLLGYGIALTQSRGGLLALLAGMGVALVARFGWKRALVVGIVVLPVMTKFVSGRQAEISTDSQTGQARVQLWSDSLVAFRQHPLFGIGEGTLTDTIGQVSHNSFVHCYTELGFLGGTLFLAAFTLAFLGVYGLRSRKIQIMQPELRHLWPYLAALVAAYIAGMFSLSRAYVVPTYLIMGLAVVYMRLVVTRPPAPPMPLSGRLVGRLAVWSVVFLMGIHAFVRFAVRWSS